MPNWRVRLPRATLVDGNLAALTLFWCGGDKAYDMAANSFGIVALPTVLHDGKAAGLQLVDIPKVAAAAALVEPQDEMIVAAAGDLRVNESAATRRRGNRPGGTRAGVRP